MHVHRVIFIILAVLTAAVGGCSKSDKSDAGRVDPKTSAGDTAIVVPENLGVIRLVTGPYSPEIVSKGFYQLRGPIPLEPFELGAHEYALMDSISNYEVLGYAEINGFDAVVDSLDPGTYTLLVYVSRLSRSQTKLDTIVSSTGDTTITDPIKAMPPYDYYFRPILVDSVVVSAGQVSTVDLSSSLEKWGRPTQTDKGWEAPRARYLKYDRGRAEVR